MLLYIFILAIIILSFYILFSDNKNTKTEDFCDLDMNNIKIIRRGNSYEKLIDDLINKKKDVFSDDQMKIMRNKNQYYDVEGTDNIKNISEKIYSDCKGKFASGLNNNGLITNKKYKNTEYDGIVNKLNKDITEASSYKGQNIPVLENDNYLRNYYLDVFGNRIESTMDDYFANYYLTIDDEYGKIPKKEIKVGIIEGDTNFIIPNQYENNKHMTNAYNVDWSRIINPITYY
jgi:hypothetical protein